MSSVLELPDSWITDRLCNPTCSPIMRYQTLLIGKFWEILLFMEAHSILATYKPQDIGFCGRQTPNILYPISGDPSQAKSDMPMQSK